MPRHRCPFLDEQAFLGFTHGALRWRSLDRTRLYEWDETHEHVEVYNRRGKHLGVLDGEGRVSGPAKEGRKISV